MAPRSSSARQPARSCGRLLDRCQRPLEAWIIGAALLLGMATAGCTRVVSLSELDRLNRSLDARTIVIGEGVSIYSPLPLDSTVAFCQIVLAEERALRELFAAKIERPIAVQLLEMDGLFPADVLVNGQSIHVGVIPERQGPRVLGYAGRDEAVIYVVPDQQVRDDHGTQVVHVPATRYRRVIRHELAHVFLYRLDLPSDSWLQEGLAETIENFTLRNGSLIETTPRFEPEDYEAACHSSLADLLDWRENGYRVEQGLEVPSITHRQLSHSLVSFLLDRAPDQPFREAVLALGKLSRAEILVVEPDWRAWLRDHCPVTEGRGR